MEVLLPFLLSSSIEYLRFNLILLILLFSLILSLDNTELYDLQLIKDEFVKYGIEYILFIWCVLSMVETDILSYFFLFDKIRFNI